MKANPKATGWHIVGAVIGAAMTIPSALVKRRIIPNYNPRYLFGGLGAFLLVLGHAAIATAARRFVVASDDVVLGDCAV